MEILLMFCEAKLDFTDALVTHNTLDIDVDLRIGGQPDPGDQAGDPR
jgi:hypothetical protein